ncbi:hypothetical protein E1460_23350 [Salmonella enterica subsp. enterica serovar Caracas]|nr:hypothetical protein [Salmonella enterica subsp. enterica serovar Caracas]
MLFYNRKVLFFLFFICSCERAMADCTGAISLPLFMNGSQTQLMWSGTIGGSGSGQATSNCPAITYKPSRYDFRYNLIETQASCINNSTGQVYLAPITTDSAVIETGAMQKLNPIISGGKTYDIWGGLYANPASGQGFTGSYGGSYSTKARLDISALPAGSYRCSIKNSHGIFRTDTNSIELGTQKVFDYTEKNGGWATGDVNVTMKASCSVPDSLNIIHGTLMTGEQNTKQETIKVTCNRDFTINVTLKADGDLADGVMVKLTGNGGSASESILSASNDGRSYGKNMSVRVGANTSSIIYFRSILQASGEGQQLGRAFAQINYY